MSLGALFENTRFYAAALILVVAIAGAFWAVLIKYLQDEGIHAVQLFVLSQFWTWFYSCILHLVRSTRDWYKDLKQGENMLIDEVKPNKNESLQSAGQTDEQTQLLLIKRKSDSVSGDIDGSYTSSIATLTSGVSVSQVDLEFEYVFNNLPNLKTYILSIFPSINSKGFKVAFISWFNEWCKFPTLYDWFYLPW